MKIALLAAGGPGEVQMFLALALGLQHLGHRTVLAASEHAADEIGSYPVEYQPLPGGCGEPRLLDCGPIAPSEQYAWHAALLSSCRDCDAVICSPALLFEAGVISESLGKPFMFVLPCPLLPATAAFPQFMVRAKPSSFRMFNRFSHYLFQSRHESRRVSDVNVWRIRLGLEPLAGPYFRRLAALKVPVLHAYSPSLVPPPADWGRHHFVSGALWIDGSHVSPRAAMPLPDAFARWLEQGSPPVYIAADSLPAPDTDMRRRIGVAADLAKRLKVRAVIAVDRDAVGPAEEPLTDDVWLTKRADPRPILAGCRCAVHSGDARTTHAAAEAGTPSLICSRAADQAFWGARIAALRIGRHMPARRAAPERLMRAIRALMPDESMRKRATALGVAIREENGLLYALDWVEKQLPDAPVFSNEPG